MSVIGIGIDVVNIKRIKNILKKNKKNFLKKILNDKELKKNISEAFISKRFAAKEAFSKALGIGIGKNLSFKDITILNDKNGKPKILINNKIKKIIFKLYKLKKFTIHLSLTDDYPFAIANVLILKG